jgi:hypothetical protein
MRLRPPLLLSLPVTLLLASCVTGDVSQIVPTSNGGHISVPLTRGGPQPGQADGYKVEVAILQPGKEKRESFYTFGLVASREPALRRIQIEDISDEKPSTLVDVTDPKFENRRWRTDTEAISADDPRMKWVYQIPLSMRVYHFTLTRLDGSQVAFDHVTVYPPVMKALVRNHWGEKY